MRQGAHSMLSGRALNPIADDFVKEEESNTKEKVT